MKTRRILGLSLVIVTIGAALVFHSSADSTAKPGDVNEARILAAVSRALPHFTSLIAVMDRAEARDIAAAAIAGGMRAMFDDGLAKAQAGLTTLEEVLRVTGEP